MVGLREKAHKSMSDFNMGSGSSYTRHTSPETPIEGDDELDKLGGKTRLVDKTEHSASPPSIQSSPSPVNPNASLSSSSSPDEQFTPSVVEYLQAFGGHQFLSGPPALPALSQPYLDSSAMYSLSPNSPQEPTAYHLQPQPQYSEQQSTASFMPMPNALSLPQYLPVFDFASLGSQNGYHAMQIDNDMLNGHSSMGNVVHPDWQDLLPDLGPMN
jgi:hypothetical protein